LSELNFRFRKASPKKGRKGMLVTFQRQKQKKFSLPSLPFIVQAEIQVQEAFSKEKRGKER